MHGPLSSELYAAKTAYDAYRASARARHVKITRDSHAEPSSGKVCALTRYFNKGRRAWCCSVPIIAFHGADDVLSNSARAL
eukprot:6182554-Pleurochrysis_carterae.AAC.3